MPKAVDGGKTTQILLFIQSFTAEKGFGPTIREIGRAVGLSSTSTVVGYLSRMSKAGLVSSIPGSPRSIHVVEQAESPIDESDGCLLLKCKFRFPEGAYPMSVIAMVSDNHQNQITPVSAEAIEVVHVQTAKR